MTQVPELSSGFQAHRKETRIAVACFYFCMGLCFASWASRIPDIKTALGLGDAAFGTILFALPAGQLVMMPLSGRLVTRFGSRNVILLALPSYVLCLTNLGLVTRGWQLAMCLFLFGLCANMCNISINTQGVAAERLYGRPIMSSFHGGWSIAGFCGAVIGMVMINLHIRPYAHFWTIVAAIFVIASLNHRKLVPGRMGQTTTTHKGLFSRPDSALLQLGVIAFCSMASEGTMFDWSGIYFRDVVRSPASLVIVGYTSFMIMMASGRFVSDRLVARFGRKRVLQVNGMLISGGLFLAVIFPYLITATIAFMIVGLGVSSVIPSVYSAAGRQRRVPPGMALATVSSIGFLGFLMGPPLIGYIAAAAGLRYSFALIGVIGVCIAVLVSKLKLIL